MQHAIEGRVWPESSDTFGPRLPCFFEGGWPESSDVLRQRPESSVPARTNGTDTKRPESSEPATVTRAAMAQDFRDETGEFRPSRIGRLGPCASGGTRGANTVPDGFRRSTWTESSEPPQESTDRVFRHGSAPRSRSSLTEPHSDRDVRRRRSTPSRPFGAVTTHGVRRVLLTHPSSLFASESRTCSRTESRRRSASSKEATNCTANRALCRRRASCPHSSG